MELGFGVKVRVRVRVRVIVRVRVRVRVRIITRDKFIITITLLPTRGHSQVTLRGERSSTQSFILFG